VESIPIQSLLAKKEKKKRGDFGVTESTEISLRFFFPPLQNSTSTDLTPPLSPSFLLLPTPPRAGPLQLAPALSFCSSSVAASSSALEMTAAMLRARCAPVSAARASTSASSASALPSTSRAAAAAAVPLRRSIVRSAAADVELSPGSPPADLIIVTGDAPSAPSSGAKVLEKKRSRRFKELKSKVRKRKEKCGKKERERERGQRISFLVGGRMAMLATFSRSFQSCQRLAFEETEATSWRKR